MSFIRNFGFAAATITLATAASPAGAALIMHKDLPLQPRQRHRRRRHRRLRRQGLCNFRRRGRCRRRDIVAMRADDASPHTMENARRKAYTAMTFNRPRPNTPRSSQDPNSVAAPAGDAAERDRYSRRRADQGRQRGHRRHRRFRFAGRRRGLRQCRPRQGQGPAAVCYLQPFIPARCPPT